MCIYSANARWRGRRDKAAQAFPLALGLFASSPQGQSALVSNYWKLNLRFESQVTKLYEPRVFINLPNTRLGGSRMPFYGVVRNSRLRIASASSLPSNSAMSDGDTDMNHGLSARGSSSVQRSTGESATFPVPKSSALNAFGEVVVSVPLVRSNVLLVEIRPR